MAGCKEMEQGSLACSLKSGLGWDNILPLKFACVDAASTSIKQLDADPKHESSQHLFLFAWLECWMHIHRADRYMDCQMHLSQINMSILCCVLINLCSSHTFQVAKPITWPQGEIAGVTTGSKVTGSI